MRTGPMLLPHAVAPCSCCPILLPMLVPHARVPLLSTCLFVRRGDAGNAATLVRAQRLVSREGNHETVAERASSGEKLEVTAVEDVIAAAHENDLFHALWRNIGHREARKAR